MIKIIIDSTNKLKVFLKGKSDEIKRKAEVGLSKTGFFIHSEVKESIAGRRAEHVSVDTGRFLNSVDIIISGKKVVVFSDIPYAKFLEFGTSKFEGRHHFSNTKDRNQTEIKRIINNEIKNI